MKNEKKMKGLPYELLTAKLSAYGFSNNSLCLMHNYEKQISKVDIGSISSYSRKKNVGAPQGSVLGPLLLNIFINGFFLVSLDSETCNFADHNTIFAFGSYPHEIASVLKNDLSNKLLEWFICKGMIVNPKNSN